MFAALRSVTLASSLSHSMSGQRNPSENGTPVKNWNVSSFVVATSNATKPEEADSVMDVDISEPMDCNPPEYDMISSKGKKRSAHEMLR